MQLVKIGFLLNPSRRSLGAGVGVDNLLLEDACNFLLEDGVCVLLLE